MLLRHLPMIRIVSGSTLDMMSPSRSEGARTNVLCYKAGGQAGRADHGADVCCDLGAADRKPLVLVAYHRKRSCAGGAVALKVCDVATQRCHRTALGMACSALVNGFSFDTIFFGGEEEAGKIRSGSGGWDCGGQGCVERLLADEELEISEKKEVVSSVCRNKEENWWCWCLWAGETNNSLFVVACRPPYRE